MEIKRQRNLLLARASCAAFISASRTLEGGKSVFSHPIEFPYFSETFFHRGRYNQCMYICGLNKLIVDLSLAQHITKIRQYHNSHKSVWKI